MTAEFARKTVANNSDLLGLDERTALSLVQPTHRLALSQAMVKAITQNRIRQAMSLLAHENIENVHAWLAEVAKDSPAEAVRLFIELAKFSLPQLKETAVTVTQNGSAKTYSSSDELLAELNKPDA